MKTIIFVMLLSVFFVGCSAPSVEQAIDETDDFRVNVLYEHTVLMIQYSQGVNLEDIGLYTEYIEDDAYLSIDEKIEQLKSAYNTTNGSISHLEEVMVVMMDDWAEQLE